MSEDYGSDGHHHHGHHPGHDQLGLHEVYQDEGQDMPWGHPADLLAQYDHLDPNHVDTSHFIGDPNDLAVWHQQTYPDDCGVVGQQFILEEITGQPHSEDECVRIAEATGGYYPHYGTPWGHIGDVLNAYGIPTESQLAANMDDIRHQLQQHNKVLVGVDSSIEAGIPGHHTNHIVQVVGIDDTDPQHPKITLNDPSPSGQGVIIPGEKFYESWGATGNFMMHTNGASLAQVLPSVESANQS